MYPEYIKFTTGSTQNESKGAVNFKEVVNTFETSLLLPDLILRVVLTDDLKLISIALRIGSDNTRLFQDYFSSCS